jgi:xylulokinase
VPAHDELVALGAAAQAASVLLGEAPDDVARRWDTSAGTRLDAVPRDEDALARIRSVRERSEALDLA